jgi:hypothetical protein
LSSLNRGFNIAWFISKCSEFVAMELDIEERSYFNDLFPLADADKDGKIGASDAAFFRKASLPDIILGKVRFYK